MIRAAVAASTRRVKQGVRAGRARRALHRVNGAFLYHHVGEKLFDGAKFHSLSMAEFRRQIQFLRRRFEFVDEQEFFTAPSAGSKAARRQKALLSFDDGYRQTLDVVEHLDELKIPSIYFVNSATVAGDGFWRDRLRAVIDAGRLNDFIGSGFPEFSGRASEFYALSKTPTLNSAVVDQRLSAFIAAQAIPNSNMDVYACSADIQRACQSAYFRVGNHSQRHYFLSSLSASEQRSEITACQEYLQQEFAAESISQTFSMPFGSLASFTSDTTDILKSLGFNYLLISEPQRYLRKQPPRLQLNGLPTHCRMLPKPRQFSWWS